MINYILIVITVSAFLGLLIIIMSVTVALCVNVVSKKEHHILTSRSTCTLVALDKEAAIMSTETF